MKPVPNPEKARAIGFVNVIGLEGLQNAFEIHSRDLNIRNYGQSLRKKKVF